MKACVFLGPSLPAADASAILDAVYLPPARQGDVYRAVRDRAPDRIGLIDGFFEQVPAVWHKEILFALKQGVQVYGASSMGALRAAELEQFGMIGVGRIFDAYSTGSFPPFDDPFEDDDEVAVAHGPSELAYVGSDAMVDIRATLAAAERQGVIDRACRDRLAELAKGLFYKDRSYDNLTRMARNLSELEPWIPRFEDWLPEGRVSQKRQDAEALLTRLAQEIDEPAPPAFRLEVTTVWDAALRAMNKTSSGPA
ncbi:MAG: TfuA-like protein [Geminicoccaceae bacterium]